jgi:polyhydroxybutyrate depolymerase
VGRRGRSAATAAVALLALAVVLLHDLPSRALAEPAPSGTTSSAGAPAWHTVVMGSASRRFLLAEPTGPGRHPLVVVLHGLGQTTAGFLQTTGLVPAARAAGVALLAPETPDRSWNDGRFGATGRDDDGFITGVVDRLVARGVADPSRLTLVGFSNGAGMSVELLSQHPGRYAAAMLVGGELLSAPGAPVPHSAVTTVLVHGTDDPVQPWLGRPTRTSRLPAQAGVPKTLAAFLTADGATGPGDQTALTHAAGRVGVVRQHWSGAADVSLYRLVGAGHVWPVDTCPASGCHPAATVARLADVSATRLAVDLATTASLPST